MIIQLCLITVYNLYSSSYRMNHIYLKLVHVRYLYFIKQSKEKTVVTSPRLSLKIQTYFCNRILTVILNHTEIFLNNSQILRKSSERCLVKFKKNCTSQVDIITILYDIPVQSQISNH